MAAEDVLSLRVVGRYQDQNIVNTLHYVIDEQGETEADICEVLIDEWDTAMQVLWLGRHIDTYELVGLKAFRETGVAKTPAFKLIGNNGSVVGEEVLAAVCRTVTLYTESAKHRRHGRVMLSGTDTAMIRTTDGGITAAEITALETMAATLIANLATNGTAFSLCIPATDADPLEKITDYAGRVTPSIITSRRIKQFMIG